MNNFKKSAIIGFVIGLLIAGSIFFSRSGFMDLLFLNPDSTELSQAFVAFEAREHRSRNTMTYVELHEYVTLVRKEAK